MKPTKNRVYCYGCNKTKMLFESKTKADNFIAFNSEGMLEENGKAPVRSYYCEFCGGYHVTSNRSIADGESMDQRDQEFIDLISSYKQNAKDYNQIHQTVSNMIKKVKRQLCFGNFELADELYEDFQIGPDSLLRLPQKNRSQYMMLRHKVKNLKEFADR